MRCEEFISTASLTAAIRFAVDSGIRCVRATSDGDGGIVIYEREGEDEISYDVYPDGGIDRVEFKSGRRAVRSKVR